MSSSLSSSASPSLAKSRRPLSSLSSSSSSSRSPSRSRNGNSSTSLSSSPSISPSSSSSPSITSISSSSPSPSLSSPTRCFVTVGTTNFDSLIHYLNVNCHKFLTFLSQNHFSHLTIQIGGTAKVLPTALLNHCKNHFLNIQMDYFPLTLSISSYLSSSSLIISHAGAGSILESLRSPSHPHILVVINETLMNNHQRELGMAMRDEGYVEYGKVDEVMDKLEKMKVTITFPLKSKGVKNQGRKGQGKKSHQDDHNNDDMKSDDNNDIDCNETHKRYPPPNLFLFSQVVMEEMSDHHQQHSLSRWDIISQCCIM